MPAVSEARLNANRRNALKSTGPRTPAGKARVALNAVRHALTARGVVSVDESAESFEGVRRQLVEEWRPASVVEIALVDQIAELLWRRARVASIETTILQRTEDRSVFASGRTQAPPPDVRRTLSAEMRDANSGIMRVQLYQMRIDRALFRAIAELRRLQIDRRQRDDEPVTDFESFDLDAPEEPHIENEQTNPPDKVTVTNEPEKTSGDEPLPTPGLRYSEDPDHGRSPTIDCSSTLESGSSGYLRPGVDGAALGNDVINNAIDAKPSDDKAPCHPAPGSNAPAVGYHRGSNTKERIAMVEKAVILARGLGTRMRKADDAAQLDEQTAKIAATGVKAMIPTLGRPFLDFVLSTLADAGFKKVCLIIGPEHEEIRNYYGKTMKPTRLSIEFAVQEKPLGTGDAVRPAEAFAAGDPFVMINSDNFYPAEALSALRTSTAPAVAVFGRDAMLSGSNIAPDRISKFSVVKSNADGSMKQIIEKPDDATLAALGDDVFVSMNCWLFSAKIFDACRAIPPSPRGEYEITDAAQYCIDVLGESLKVQKVYAPVLDMSSRGDIAAVNDKLRGIDVRL